MMENTTLVVVQVNGKVRGWPDHRCGGCREEQVRERAGGNIWWQNILIAVTACVKVIYVPVAHSILVVG